MTITELVGQSHALARQKGFWDSDTDSPNVPEKLCLIHSEISEALEELRDGSLIQGYHLATSGKPEGFGIELADAVIRIADLCGALGIDLEQAISVKHAYNKSRPQKHGKAF